MFLIISLLSTIFPLAPKEVQASQRIKKGDYLRFEGHTWEFRTGDNYSGTGATRPVDWIVAAEKHNGYPQNSVTLISKEIVAKHVFDDSNSTHWGNSGTGTATKGIRKFLNGSSYTGSDNNIYNVTMYDSIPASIRGAILTTDLENKAYSTGTGYTTKDKIFLPSQNEIGAGNTSTYAIGSDWGYFSSDSSRIAKFVGADRYYWLRSPSSNTNNNVRCVSSNGSHYSNSANSGAGGVRPALNLDLSSVSIKSGSGTEGNPWVVTTSTIVESTAGANFSAILMSDGHIWTWGNNHYGQLGYHSDTRVVSEPRRIEKINNIVQIAAGHTHCLALDRDGNVFAWGNNASAQLGNGNTILQFEPIGIAFPEEAGKIIQIASGYNFSLALDENKKLWGWGNNGSGQLALPSVTTYLTPVQIPIAMPTGVFIKKIVADKSYHALALDSQNKVWAWGRNNENQVNQTTSTIIRIPMKPLGEEVVQGIGIGERHSLAYTNNKVYAWGWNNYGQLGVGDRQVYTLRQEIPISASGLKQIVGGLYFSVALFDDGRMFIWGLNSSGQFGNGTTVSSNSPLQILNHSKYEKIATGSSHVIAIEKEKPTFWSWGYGIYGELGDRKRVSRATPLCIELPPIYKPSSVISGKPNGPILTSGLLPIKWNNTLRKWVETNEDDAAWFSEDFYSEGQNKWANAIIGSIEQNDYLMFVWIPRFTYRIESPDQNKRPYLGDRISIRFSNGDKDDTTNNFKIHPAFQFGEEQLDGFWAAKFPASKRTGSAEAEPKVNVKPGIESWNHISISDAFLKSLEIKEQFGLGASTDTHLMKNDEWGAIAYLTEAIGHIPASAGAHSGGGVGDFYLNSTDGFDKATTGNRYGVYNMFGRNEFAAAYIKNTFVSTNGNGEELQKAALQYKNEMPIGFTDRHDHNYNAAKTIVNGKALDDGMALTETSEMGLAYNGWGTAAAYYPHTNMPFFRRGGTGIFSYLYDTGASHADKTFRPALVVTSPQPNTPELASTMWPIRWDASSQNWKRVINPSQEQWYDYAHKQWANMVTGKSVEQVFDQNGYLRPSSTADYAMFVWVPRYTYKIDHTKELGKKINVRFSTDGNYDFTGNGYRLHPAFQYGKYELPGIWVGKFKASSNNNKVNVKPGIQIWTNQTISQMFDHTKEITSNYNMSRIVESHLMKNDEWGAAAYLTEALGELPEQSTTNFAGGSAGDQTVYITNTKHSNTRSPYGIYDLFMQDHNESVASYVYSTDLIASPSNMSIYEAEDRFKDLFPKGVEDTAAANFEAATPVYSDGRAIKEVCDALGTSGAWGSAKADFPHDTKPFFVRGTSGIFGFDIFSGEARATTGFRPVIAVIGNAIQNASVSQIYHTKLDVAVALESANGIAESKAFGYSIDRQEFIWVDHLSAEAGTYSFSIGNLKANKTYADIRIRFKDRTGNVSESYALPKATTLAYNPQNVLIEVISGSSNQAKITIVNNPNNDTVPAHKIYLVPNNTGGTNATSIETAFSNQTSLTISNLNPDVSYKLQTITRNALNVMNAPVPWITPLEEIQRIANDMIPPTVSLTINEGETFTTASTVNLKLSAQDNITPPTALKVQFSLDGETWVGYNGANYVSIHWGDYRTNYPAFSLGTVGEKTIYVRVRDENGNIGVHSAQIKYVTQDELTVLEKAKLIANDTTPPTARLTINYGAVRTVQPKVPLKLTAVDNITKSTDLKVQFSLGGQIWRGYEGNEWKDNVWGSYQAGEYYPDFDLGSVGQKIISARVRDEKGNITVVTASIHYAAVAVPEKPTVQFPTDTTGGGSGSGSSTVPISGAQLSEIKNVGALGSVVLTTSPKGQIKTTNTGSFSFIRYSTDGIVWSPWETAPTADISKSISFPQVDGLKTVYIQTASNLEDVYSEIQIMEFVMDSTPPVIQMRTESGAYIAVGGDIKIVLQIEDNISKIIRYDVNLNGSSHEASKKTSDQGTAVVQFTNLAAGVHEIAVKATDHAGNSTIRTLKIWSNKK